MTYWNARFSWTLLALCVAVVACDDDPSEEDVTREDVGVDVEDVEGVDTDTSADIVDEAGYTIEGLSAPVAVSFDERGVLHADCQTNEDCYAVQGYFHAAHRFAQMDLKRRLATGRLSGLLAIAEPSIIALDAANRHLLSTREGEPLEKAIYDRMDEESRRVLASYTRGVNAWLADARAGRNGARLGPEYEFAAIGKGPEDIDEWAPTDSIAAGLTLLQALTDYSSPELLIGSLVGAVGPEVALDYVSAVSISQTDTVSASGESYPPGPPTGLRTRGQAADYQAIAERLKPATRALREAYQKVERIRAFQQVSLESTGSNNWVMGPDQTSSGEPILANDPHLPLTNPALWYLVELDAKTRGQGDLHISGVSFSGVPGILLGHNEDIAWGGTVVFYDLGDVYVEELTEDGGGVVFEGEAVPFLKKTITIETASGTEERELLWVPHHGPVLSIDPEAGTAVTFRWMVHDARTDLMVFEKLGRAGDMAEAKQVLELAQTTNQNFVVIDTSGDIGWFPYSDVPSRSWENLADVPYWLPLPGDGSAEWDAEPVPRAELPQMENPTNGFIATANQDMSGAFVDGDPTNDGYTPLQTPYMAPGARHTRIVELIERDSGAHTVETNQAIQGDNHIWLAEQLLPEMLTVIDDRADELSPGAQAVRNTLDAWRFSCPTGLQSMDPASEPVAEQGVLEEAAGCSAFHVLIFNTLSRAFDDELALGGFSTSDQPRATPLFWLIKDPSKLAKGATYWDDVSTDSVTETQSDVMVAAMEESATILADKFGEDPSSWLWGRIHVAELNAQLFDQFVDDFNYPPVAAPGGLLAVNVANPSPDAAGAGDYGFGAGPSMRHVATVEDGQIASYWNLPGGQRAFTDSAYYDNLLEGWTKNEFFRMPFTRAEAEAAAVERFVFEPQE